MLKTNFVKYKGNFVVGVYRKNQNRRRAWTECHTSADSDRDVGVIYQESDDIVGNYIIIIFNSSIVRTEVPEYGAYVIAQLV